MQEAIEHLQTALKYGKLAEAAFLVEMKAADTAKDNQKANICEDSIVKIQYIVRDLEIKVSYLKESVKTLDNRKA